MQQFREAFPWDQAPRYLLRDRYAIYGSEFAAITKGMGVEETHLALAKDTREHRAVEQPEQGHVTAIPQVGGLHHRYLRPAA